MATGTCCFYEGTEAPTLGNGPDATGRCAGTVVAERQVHGLVVPCCDDHRVSGGFVRLVGLQQAIMPASDADTSCSGCGAFAGSGCALDCPVDGELLTPTAPSVIIGDVAGTRT